MSRALVIGAGVAGPAVAMFLQRARWEAEIYESEAEPDPFEGLFLNVATNGLAVLAELGIRERLLSDGHRLSKIMPVKVAIGFLGEYPRGRSGIINLGSGQPGSTRPAAKGLALVQFD